MSLIWEIKGFFTVLLWGPNEITHGKVQSIPSSMDWLKNNAIGILSIVGVEIREGHLIVLKRNNYCYPTGQGEQFELRRNQGMIFFSKGILIVHKTLRWDDLGLEAGASWRKDRKHTTTELLWGHSQHTINVCVFRKQ